MTIIRKFNPQLPSYWEGQFGKDSSDSFWYPRTGLNIPAVNVTETNDEFTIEVAAPGFRKEDFNIKLHNQVLTISSNKSENNTDSNRRYTKKEFSYNGFERTFTLPNTIESEKIEAAYENGILRINVPKREEAKVKPPKSIEIK